MGASAPGFARSRYSSGAILLHWTIAILIIANITGALISEGWDEQAHARLMAIHKAIGMTVLVLSVVRVAWRLTHRPPPLPPRIGTLEKAGAGIAYLAFYAMMIAIPVSGWMMSSASANRRPFNWFGLFDLPFLPIQGNKMLGGFGHEAHEILGYTMIALIVLHVVAALKHQFFDDARLFARMWPGRRAPGA